MTVDTTMNAIYCLIMAFWTTIFVESWKRKSNEIAHIWDMDGFIRKSDERSDFRADYFVDPNTKKIVKKPATNSYLRRITVEMPTVIFAVGLVIACFIGYRQWYTSTESFTSQTAAACANAGAIILFGLVYRKVAVVLANWENHRYQEEWENSLITKNFAF